MKGIKSKYKHSGETIIEEELDGKIIILDRYFHEVGDIVVLNEYDQFSRHMYYENAFNTIFVIVEKEQENKELINGAIDRLFKYKIVSTEDPSDFYERKLFYDLIKV